MECVDDVLHELHIVADRPPPRVAGDERPSADRVLQAMGRATLSIDQLVALTGLAAPQLAAHLARLEMRGTVAALPGGRFQRAEARVIE